MLVEEFSAVGLIDCRENLWLALQTLCERARAVVREVRGRRVDHHDDGVAQLGKVVEIVRAKLHDAQVLGEDVDLAGVDTESGGCVGPECHCEGERKRNHGTSATLNTGYQRRGEAAERLVDRAYLGSKAGLGRLGAHVTQGSAGPHGALAG